MAKTYQNAIDEARVILKDTSTTNRYTDEILLSILNRALQELGRLRPDAFTDRFDDDSGDIIVPEVRATDDEEDSDSEELDVSEDSVVALTDELDIPMMFYMPIVQFIAGWAEVIDDEFTTDGRAGMLIDRFKLSVIGL